VPGGVLHLHEPRLGIGLPSKTVRPFRRSGDSILDAFGRAVATPAERIVVTGRLFDRPAPAAHLVSRVVDVLGDRVRDGVPAAVPAGAPMALLFLAAGITLDADIETGIQKGGAAPFWRHGEFRVLQDGRVRVCRVPLPGTKEVRLDVTGLTARTVMDRMAVRLARTNGARFLRVVLTGASDDPGVLGIGPRDLQMVLPSGVEGALLKEFAPPPPQPPATEEREDTLRAARARMPDLPETTGTYEFLDDRGRVLYVGKAVNIRRRVASHFTAEIRERSPRGPMLTKAHTIRHREAPNELMALLAEARRIREVRPPFNRQMRDPEAARYLRVMTVGPGPGLTARREVEDDGADWYGPFPKRWAVERSLRTLQVIYGLASCRWRFGETAPAVCTDRDTGVCCVPCRGRTSGASYRERIRMAADFLLDRAGPPPPFGALNPLSAGMLGEEDRRILSGFAAGVRRFLDTLSGATGLVLLPGGRALLVLGGLVAFERDVEPGREDAVRRWARGRIRAYETGPPRTWLPVDRAEEGRILAFWMRKRSGGPSTEQMRRTESADAPDQQGARGSPPSWVGDPE